MFVVIFRDEFSTICQSFIVVVVHEGVKICNPKWIRNRSSDARIRLKNVRGARERQGGQRPWPSHHVWRPCATRDQRAGWAMWHTASTRGGKAMAFGHLASPAHLSRSSAVFWHPNSDFESVFRLRIVTPSRTMKNTKL